MRLKATFIGLFKLVEADVTLTGGSDDLSRGDDVRLVWSAEQTMCFAQGL